VSRLYLAEVFIGNKPQARDPEGATIMKDLMHKGGFDCVKDIRTGKTLLIRIEAESPGEARDLIFKMCSDLRIYNPVAHICEIDVRGEA